MAKIDWTRDAARRAWARAGTQYRPPKPRSTISIARERVAICQADLHRAKPDDRPTKLRRLNHARAALLIEMRKGNRQNVIV